MEEDRSSSSEDEDGLQYASATDPIVNQRKQQKLDQYFSQMESMSEDITPTSCNLFCYLPS